MLLLVVLPVVFDLMPVDSVKNELIRARLVGNWRVVATEKDGKVVQAEQSGYKIVISGSTVSMLLGEVVVHAATYRVDASKTPAVMHQTVTRAPCMSGAQRELEETILFDGKTLKLGGLVLKRLGR